MTPQLIAGLALTGLGGGVTRAARRRWLMCQAIRTSLVVIAMVAAVVGMVAGGHSARYVSYPDSDSHARLITAREEGLSWNSVRLADRDWSHL